jgi:hypothetical protein
VTSANCTAGQGARMNDTVSGEFVAYVVDFDNPATGGSSDVAGLLGAGACSGQIGRDVTNWKPRDEVTTVAGRYTGDSLLSAGTYSDSLTITMTVK